MAPLTFAAVRSDILALSLCFWSSDRPTTFEGRSSSESGVSQNDDYVLWRDQAEEEENTF